MQLPGSYSLQELEGVRTLGLKNIAVTSTTTNFQFPYLCIPAPVQVFLFLAEATWSQCLDSSEEHLY
mgnify:CR=1 FL=1